MQKITCDRCGKMITLGTLDRDTSYDLYYEMEIHPLDPIRGKDLKEELDIRKKTRTYDLCKACSDEWQRLITQVKEEFIGGANINVGEHTFKPEINKECEKCVYCVTHHDAEHMSNIKYCAMKCDMSDPRTCTCFNPTESYT